MLQKCISFWGIFFKGWFIPQKMGVITGIKTTRDNKVIVGVELDYEESLKLKGHVQNIFLFSEDAAEIKTNLTQRGSNEATKYFLIPRELRENLTFNKKVKCQRIETNSRIFFVYSVEKEWMFNKN